jgi:hypothetical protein
LRGLGVELEKAGLERPDSLDARCPPEQRGNFDREAAELRLGSRGQARPWELKWREEWLHAPAMRDTLGERDDRQRRLSASSQLGLAAGGRLTLAGHYQRRESFSNTDSLETTEQFQAEGRAAWIARPGGWGGEGLYALGSRRQRLRQSQLVFVGVGQGDLNAEGVFVGEGEGDYRRRAVLGEAVLRTRDLELEARVLREEARTGSVWNRLGSETRLSLREETTDPQLWALALLRPSQFQKAGSTLLGAIELRQELRLRPGDGPLDLRYGFRYADRMDARDAIGRRDEIDGEHRLRVRRAGDQGSVQLELLSNKQWRRSTEGLGGGAYDVRGAGAELTGTQHLPGGSSLSLKAGLARKKDADRALKLRELTLDPSLSVSPFRSLRLNAGWEFKHSSYQDGDPAQGRPWFFDPPGWRKVLSLEATAQAGSNLTLSARYEMREEVDRPRRHRLRMESRAFF